MGRSRAMAMGLALARFVSWQELKFVVVVVACRTRRAGERSINLTPHPSPPLALEEFQGVPEGVLAGKFLQGVKADDLGPFFSVGLTCTNLQESPRDL